MSPPLKPDESGYLYRREFADWKREVFSIFVKDHESRVRALERAHYKRAAIEGILVGGLAFAGTLVGSWLF